MTNRGAYDPGWNDPPKLSFAPEGSGSKPKNILNKRVPFSLNGSENKSGQTVQPPAMIPPPMMQLPIGVLPLAGSQPPIGTGISHPLGSIPSIPTIDDAALCDISDTEQLSEIVKILNNIICDSTELSSKADGIRKRINTMETMWRENKLSKDVQSRTYQLSKALESSNAQLADEIHKSLMIDYSSVVSSWMVGIKQLIVHCSVVNELLEIDKE